MASAAEVLILIIGGLLFFFKNVLKNRPQSLEVKVKRIELSRNLILPLNWGEVLRIKKVIQVGHIKIVTWFYQKWISKIKI